MQDRIASLLNIGAPNFSGDLTKVLEVTAGDTIQFALPQVADPDTLDVAEYSVNFGTATSFSRLNILNSSSVELVFTPDLSDFG